jgi:hypothetical protein
MDLLMKLEKQAKKAKGYLHALIGNHEAMNVYGDLRYVHPGEYASFADEKSERRREKAYKQHTDYVKQYPPDTGVPEFNDAYRQKWFAARPLGYVEHREDFATSGKYGRWIARHNAVIKINDLLFLHGGIGPKYAAEPIERLNKTIQSELRDINKIMAGGMTADSEGPLWYRGLARNEEATEEPHLEVLLKNLGVNRIVMGHTVTDGTVMPRFGGRAILIDVGMAEAYGHRQACLLIEGERLSTIHRGKQISFPADGGQDLLRYLKECAALDPSPSPLAAKIATLEKSLITAGGE